VHDDALIGSRLGSYGAVRTQGEGGTMQKVPGVKGNCVQILPSLHEQLMTPPQESNRSPHGIGLLGSPRFCTSSHVFGLQHCLLPGAQTSPLLQVLEQSSGTSVQPSAARPQNVGSASFSSAQVFGVQHRFSPVLQT
jgi:hypothetical protein